jgi:glutathione S-transferase
MHLFLALERDASTAIPLTLDLLGGDDAVVTLVDEAADRTSLAFEGGKESITGHHSVFLFASRLAHTMHSDPHAAALVDMWLEMERDTMAKLARVPPARQGAFLRSVLRLLDDHLEGENWLLPTFTASTAADFCWIARLQWLQKRHALALDDFPHVRRYMEQDPREELLLSEDEEDGA